MGKVIVSVIVPSVNICFDAMLPEFVEVGRITQLLVEATTGITNEEYVASNEELLCWMEKEVVLSGNKLLADYNVKNGDHLLLC